MLFLKIPVIYFISLLRYYRWLHCSLSILHATAGVYTLALIVDLHDIDEFSSLRQIQLAFAPHDDEMVSHFFPSRQLGLINLPKVSTRLEPTPFNCMMRILIIFQCTPSPSIFIITTIIINIP